MILVNPSSKNPPNLAGLVLNITVEIKSYGTDRYGRTLGVVYLNGTNVNLEIGKSRIGRGLLRAA